MSGPRPEFSHDQIFSTEPIYQIVNAMGDFNRLIESFPDRESLLNELGVKEASNELGPFAYLRRSWVNAENPHKDIGYFNFTYFLIPQFLPERVEEIARHINDKWDSVWEPFIRFMESKAKRRSTIEAYHWLRAYHSKMKENNSTGHWRKS